MKRFFPLILALAALPWGSGCGTPRPEPVVEDIPGYEALREQFSGRDMSPVRGRRIVLDPGHGGYFKGAVGVGGLTEAEVNLGVALYLRGLLEWAGAEVSMTRTADYDFLTASDSTLTADLAFRTSFVDSLQPDVFLSLHHNSVASLDRTVNETQTYYPLRADGASLDLARAIHRHLVLNLEISPARILPGNFHVLRNATVPAVLGEPAMISNPVMEGRLSLAASHRLEAEAYFLGLLDYFSQGSPVWSGARTDTVVAESGTSPDRISWTFVSEDTLRGPGPGPDPGTVELTLNGRPAPFHVTGPGLTVSWNRTESDGELPAVLELRGRNLRGRATPVRRTVLMPPQAGRMHLQISASSVRKDGSRDLALRWKAAGGSVLPAGRLVLGSDREVDIRGGKKGTALVPGMPAIPTAAVFRPDRSDLPDIPCILTAAELPAPWRWRHLETDFGRRVAHWSTRIYPSGGYPFGAADQAEPLIPILPGRPVWISAPGIVPLVDPAPGIPDTARTVASAAGDWICDLIVPGLYGKVVVLDAAGGGSDPDGTGPLGTRGAALNLETALLAGDLLAGCGAEVHFTRRGETVLAPEEKVRLAGDVDADLFVTIGRSPRPGTLTARHHPGSRIGEIWADLFLQAAAPVTGTADSVAVLESYDYLLRHTACPALEIRLPGPATPRQEMLLQDRGWLRAEAGSVLLSVASLYHSEARLVPTLDVAAVIAGLEGGLPPQEVEWAELDGNLAWSPLPSAAEASAPSGETGFSLDSIQGPGLPDLVGRHTLEIRAGNRWQLWLLDNSGGNLSTRLMMSNP